MAVTVQESDIIGHSSASIDAQGFVHRRGFRIDGLTSDAGIFYQAYQGLATVGVGYGLPHPKVTGLFVDKIDFAPFPQHKTSVYANAEYRTPQANRRTPAPGSYMIKVTTSSGMVKRAYGNDGKLNIITWGDPNATGNVTAILKDYVELDDENCATCIEITRTETNSPIPKSRLYRNTVNAQPIWGFGAKELMCRAIDGEQIGIGSGWTVNYRFEGGLAPDNKHSMWEQLKVFRNFDNGRIPDGIDPTDGTNNGYGFFMPKALKDFNQLALPDPTI